MKINWKALCIGILVGIIAAIAIDIYLYVFYKIDRNIHKAELRDLQYEFDMLQDKNDSLSRLIQIYQEKNDSLHNIIQWTEKQYKDLKDATSQKVDFVCDLPLDMAIEYFTEQVSKEGSLGW